MSAALKPDEEKLEIIAVDDPPAPETKLEVKVDDALASLKSQLEAEKAANAAAIERAKAAESQAAEARAESAKFQNTAQQAQYDAVSRALEGTQAALKTAKQDYATAMQEGDYVRAGDATAAISAAAQRLSQLEDGKAQMEAMRARPAPQPQRQAPQSQFSPRTTQWLQANPQVQQDPVLGAEVHAAHLRAVAAGYIADTDAYFDFIEQRVGLKQAEPPTRQNQRQPMYAAPVQPQARQPSGKQANGQFYMLPWMRDAAKVAGVSDEAWAREYKKMQDDNDFL